MGHLVNIAFQGGTHGNYLRFCIDKFSTLTSEVVGTPFTENNTSHNDLYYSGSVNVYEPGRMECKFQNTHEPHVLITIDEKDLVFIDRWITIRAGDQKVDTNKDMISVSSDFLSRFTWLEEFRKYYNIDLTKNKLPKFIMRDYYKLSFLDPNKNGFIINNKVLRENKPSNTFEFPVSCFWDKDKFAETLKNMDKHLDLKINIDGCLSVHDTFLNGLNFLETRHRVDKVINAIQEKQDMDIRDLDTVEQAYVSAWIEKNHKFVVVPLCNQFFRSTDEIINWLSHYPQQYKAMNPNLPTFNDIPNPFHLWNL
jgi:hypothetical protein